MIVKVYNMNGVEVDEIELYPQLFDISPNQPVMHQALVRQLANARQGTASTKTRSEVRRTGRKAWRQKGTGRARQGSRRAPHWVGGGIAFGPKPRSYEQKMPKKMRRLAIKSALGAKAQAGQLVIIKELIFEKPTTKEAKQLLQSLGVNSAVVLTGAKENDQNTNLSFRNLEKIKPLHWQYLNMRDIFSHEHLIIELAALKAIQELWG